MPKLLLADAAKYYRDKGDTAITKNFLYSGCRAGTLPHYKAGNRYIIDTDELNRHLELTMFNSLIPKTEPAYGTLRQIKAVR